MKILIADENSITRSALKIFLEHCGQKNSVTEVSDFRKLIEKIDKSAPEIIFLDWDFLEDGTTEMINSINTVYPLIHLILISNQKENRKEALKVGDCKFLLRSDPPKKITEMINELNLKKNIKNNLG